eukprot:TRINITY_DN1168_c0_g1_i1.p1 TRINITY_DN1168_c0_g1~~TRINITY_DN1168_c0_g1_i1.p1  ORF type:complete len:928 (+),score=223.87 TRINITY_DN1168_c0_g1_i1:30-2786(+)
MSNFETMQGPRALFAFLPFGGAVRIDGDGIIKQCRPKIHPTRIQKMIDNMPRTIFNKNKSTCLSFAENMAGKNSIKVGYEISSDLVWAVIVALLEYEFNLSNPDFIAKLREILLSVDYTPQRRLSQTFDAFESLDEVEKLLLEGKREDACQKAREKKLYVHALVLAMHLDRDLYREVLIEFVKSSFAPGSSMRTLYGLLVDRSLVFDEDNAQGLVTNWRSNLTMIISNRTPDDEMVLTRLADNLFFKHDNILAAHLCYLLGDEQFDYSNTKYPKYSLFGHNPFRYRMFDLEAYLMTECIETAKKLGNTQHDSMALIPFRLAFAQILLSMGNINEAEQLLDQVIEFSHAIEYIPFNFIAVARKTRFAIQLKKGTKDNGGRFFSGIKSFFGGSKGEPLDGHVSVVNDNSNRSRAVSNVQELPPAQPYYKQTQNQKISQSPGSPQYNTSPNQGPGRTRTKSSHSFSDKRVKGPGWITRFASWITRGPVYHQMDLGEPLGNSFDRSDYDDIPLPPSNMDFPPSNIGLPPCNIELPPSNIGLPPSNIGLPPSNGLSSSNIGLPPSNKDFVLPPSNKDLGLRHSNSDFGLPPSNTDFGLPPSNKELGLVHSSSDFGLPPSNKDMYLPPSNTDFDLPPSDTTLHLSNADFGFPPSNKDLVHPHPKSDFGLPPSDTTLHLSNADFGLPPSNKDFDLTSKNTNLPAIDATYNNLENKVDIFGSNLPHPVHSSSNNHPNTDVFSGNSNVGLPHPHSQADKITFENTLFTPPSNAGSMSTVLSQPVETGNDEDFFAILTDEKPSAASSISALPLEPILPNYSTPHTVFETKREITNAPVNPIFSATDMLSVSTVMPENFGKITEIPSTTNEPSLTTTTAGRKRRKRRVGGYVDTLTNSGNSPAQPTSNNSSQNTSPVMPGFPSSSGMFL